MYAVWFQMITIVERVRRTPGGLYTLPLAPTYTIVISSPREPGESCLRCLALGLRAHRAHLGVCATVGKEGRAASHVRPSANTSHAARA